MFPADSGAPYKLRKARRSAGRSPPDDPPGWPMGRKQAKRSDAPRGASERGPSPAEGGDVPPGPAPREGRRPWTFLTNHSHVLIVLHANPELVLREIAARVGITERAVQQIVDDLEADGFIERERVGRRNHYRLLTDQALRHPIESHCSIADLLALIVDHPKAAGNELL